MFKNILLFALFFILFSSFSYSILSSESAILNVSLDVPVSFEISKDGFLSYLNIDYVMIPVEDQRQKVISSKYSLVPLNIEDDVVSFRVTDPVDFVLNANFIVETESNLVYVSEKVYFPLSNLDSSFFKYISSSEVFDIDENIKSLAINLSLGEDDLFKVVFSLADWVNKNMVYDLDSLSSDRVPASQVFFHMNGVCTEYTSLFVSLVRSLGIPAREISGFAFTNSGLFPRGWEFHSWAEVYFPSFGWVPFDPTYGQYGFVDAGHVRLSFDNNKNSFSWRGKNVEVIPESTILNVNILSSTPVTDSSLDILYDVLEETIGPSSYNYLKISLFNNNPFYVVETIRLSGVDGLTFLSDRNQVVVLAPFESKDLFFVFRLDKDLHSNFIYTFPLKFFINEESFSTNFIAKVDGSVVLFQDISFLFEKNSLNKGFFCDSSSIIKVNEFLLVECESLYEDGVLCFNNECISLNKNDPFMISSKISEPGLFTRAVTFNSFSSTSSSFVKFLVLDDSKIKMNVSYSESLIPSDLGFINISLIKNSISIPNNVSLKIVHPYFVEEVFIDDLSSDFSFSFSFFPQNIKKGFNNISLELVFFDVLGNEFYQQENILIEVHSLSFLDELDFFFRKIYFFVKNLVSL